MALDQETLSQLLATVQRFSRDVRLFRLYEGASQIMQLVIARDMIRQAEH